MSHNYYKRRRDKRLERSRKGVEARERKRMAEADGMCEVGQITTSGCLGSHVITLLTWPGESRAVAVVVDGRHRRPRTARGVWRCVADMISTAMGAA
jgi:hypothetical protein